MRVDCRSEQHPWLTDLRIWFTLVFVFINEATIRGGEFSSFALLYWLRVETSLSTADS